MRLKLITAPTIQPVTKAEAKAHLRIDTTTEDDFIDTLIKAATNFAEEYTYRQFITATYEQYMDDFPDGSTAIKLEKPKLQSITSITYIDTAGATQTWTSTLYEADIKSDIGKVRPVSGESYPSTDDIYNAVTIKFKAGYGDAAANVPDLLKSTLKVMVSHLFENREFVTPQGQQLIFPEAILLLLDQFSLREFI